MNMNNIYMISINDKMMISLISNIKNPIDKEYYKKLFSIGYYQKDKKNIIGFLFNEYKEISEIIRKEIERYIYSKDIENIEISNLFNYIIDRKEIRGNIFHDIIIESNINEDIEIIELIIDFFLDKLESEYRKIIDL